ncbi:polysaccharide biosynthesis/export family protein [Botrimarina mediterranea]|uniref:Polysaccharide biosynthesis/export protein n=1 Tax=Botrimarina mediterranea TaxID=2528022 RepID=A0A518KBC8_9BACT|nr:polysaccharide biosynthesis/export family protein [Botrimarina mediterranea]QDV75104.1 Polysaccharide biosynthesis/export protein [Botrimarina mediterranea]QDV79749.1 Polysaccharide biosynthesis/export protein [Planctomycetes bacterium K2D]
MGSRHFGLLAPLVVAALAVCSGCHLVYPGQKHDGPQPCVPESIPRELSKVVHPDYIVEPPDVLEIEAIRITPRAPYLLEPLDVVAIAATGLLPEEQITGEYAIQPNGTIQLGYKIGAVQAAGMTTEALQAQIDARLREVYQDPQVWVTLSQLGAQQQIAGEHLVAPDGRVNLGTYGRVKVVGLTIDETRAAIESHLSAYLEAPKVSVDVLGYNSKVFYVVTQGAGLGDGVAILPSRGNETVLDAIGQIQGLQSISSTRMWVARPGGNQCGGDQILPVDWLAITQRGDASTNYQILPGDRLFVSEDKLIAIDTRLGKLIAPVERVLGVTLLGNSTVRSLQGQNGGGGFGGGGF